MKILITGCCGFIGSNLTKWCIDAGHEVVGVDNLSNGHTEFLPRDADDNLLCSFYNMDFSDEYVLTGIKRKQYDVIMHLAAVPRVAYSVEHPLETNDVNLTKTLKLIHAARSHVNKFLFASSSSVYGGAKHLPTQEDEQKNPKSPYALQKSAIEDYLSLYYDLYGLDSASLRLFNVFGPNQLGGSPYACAIASWLHAIKVGKPMRSDGDGTQSRDLCYVDNVCSAFLKAAEIPERLRAQRFNIACGDRTSNREILEYLMKAYPGSYYVDAPWRKGDVMHTHADVSLAKQVFDYVPLVKFFDGLQKTIEWVDSSKEFMSLSK